MRVRTQALGGEVDAVQKRDDGESGARRCLAGDGASGTQVQMQVQAQAQARTPGLVADGS